MKKKKIGKIILEMPKAFNSISWKKKEKIRGNCRKLVIILARFVFFYVLLGYSSLSASLTDCR